MPRLMCAWALGLSSLAALALAGSVPGFAQVGDDIYKGKQLSIMIGYGVGGSDDLWARLIARHIGDHIPGHPTVVPVNAPGAGSVPEKALPIIVSERWARLPRSLARSALMRATIASWL